MRRRFCWQVLTRSARNVQGPLRAKPNVRIVRRGESNEPRQRRRGRIFATSHGCERVDARRRATSNARGIPNITSDEASALSVSSSLGSRSPADCNAFPLDTPHDVMRAVLVASDVRLYREGLALVFEADGRLCVTSIADSAVATVERLADARPDVLLIDATMPGIATIVRATGGRSPRIPVVLFGVPAEDEDLFACIDSGVSAFVPRDASPDDLIDALLAAIRDDAIQSRSMANVLGRLANRARLADRPVETSPLTARERELATLLGEGLSNKEIAQRLHISVATVKNHVHRILEKLQVQRRGQAASRLRSENSMNPRI